MAGLAGVRKSVDSHLERLGLTRAGLSTHALRNIGAGLAYEYNHELRAVQDLLGSVDPRTFAGVVDRPVPISQ